MMHKKTIAKDWALLIRVEGLGGPEEDHQLLLDWSCKRTRRRRRRRRRLIRV